MQIVQASLPEIDLLVPLFDQYRQFYKQPPDLEGARRFLKERVGKEQSTIYLALLEGSPEGFVQLYPSFSSVSMQPIWILNDLFVASEARRRGVGRALMERARQLAVATGAKALALATQVDNSSAQSLYEELGYVRDTKFYHYILTI